MCSHHNSCFRLLFQNKIFPLKAVAAKANNKTGLIEESTAQLLRIKEHATAIKNYAGTHHYNRNTCLLVDMKLPSATNRFFVYDLKNDTVAKAGWVAHGYGSSSNEIHFSNVPGSR